jgi:YD repeat-containing protein
VELDISNVPTVKVTPQHSFQWKTYFKHEAGNLREVEEPPGRNGSTTEVTRYAYDAEGRLT